LGSLGEVTAPDQGPPGGSRRAGTPLPAAPAMAGWARQFVRATLSAWSVEEPLIEAAVLVASELATNALLHAPGPYQLDVVEMTSGVRLSVADASPLPPRLRSYRLLSTTGRGMALVVQLARAWGSELTGTGKTVWAELASTPIPGRGVGQAGWRPLPEVAGEELVWVDYLGVPVAAYLALQEDNDDLVRDCELLLTTRARPGSTPPRLLDAALALTERFARAREAHRDIVAAAASEGRDRVDLRVQVGRRGAVAGVEEYLALMEELDGFCRSGALLVDPPSDQVVALRRWFVEETTAQLGQLAGPTPFPG